MTQKKTVLLLSGGLDSATCLAMAQEAGYDVYALSFAYGQRHDVELERAKALAKAMGAVEHRVAEIDLRLFGGSALTADVDVPKPGNVDDMEADIPITYVPARNTIFLSFALAYAEVIEADAITIGVNALDYSGHPDCRPDYIAAFQHMANLATKAGVEGHGVELLTPLMHLTKAEIIAQGLRLGVDYSLTVSCYDPSPEGHACGACDSCVLRREGFHQSGSEDPTIYAA